MSRARALMRGRVVHGASLRLNRPAANPAAAQHADWPAVTPRRGAVRLARRTLAGVVALFLALVTGSAYADGLFLPVAAQDAPAMPATSSGLSAQPRGSDRQGAWERHVRIARPFLDDARDDVQRGDAGRLLLNVRPGASLDVVVERTAGIKRGYAARGLRAQPSGRRCPRLAGRHERTPVRVRRRIACGAACGEGDRSTTRYRRYRRWIRGGHLGGLDAGGG